MLRRTRAAAGMLDPGRTRVAPMPEEEAEIQTTVGLSGTACSARRLRPACVLRLAARTPSCRAPARASRLPATPRRALRQRERPLSRTGVSTWRSMAAFSPDAVPAGTKAFGHVPVVDSLAVSTSLPVGVVRASIDGPTLAVTAGLFPSEYAGIEAAARLYAQTNPADLRCGTLLILPCVNLHGFQFRTPWLNVKHTAAAPFDGQNLNAMFPGSSATDASLSSRQAAACFQVVKKATAHIDFRGGDLSESHLVHTIFPQLHDEPQLDRQRMEIALAFGLQYNLSASPTDAHSQGGAGDGSCMGELLKLGCLSFVSECGLGYLTQPREEFILNHVNGTRNVLRYLGMMAGVPRYQHAALGPQRFLLNPFVKAYAPESVRAAILLLYSQSRSSIQLIRAIAFCIPGCFHCQGRPRTHIHER